jgi:hypothetical protein
MAGLTWQQCHDGKVARRHYSSDGMTAQVKLHWAVHCVCLQHAVIASGYAAWGRHQLLLRGMELTRLSLVVCSGISPRLKTSWLVGFSQTLRLNAAYFSSIFIAHYA